MPPKPPMRIPTKPPLPPRRAPPLAKPLPTSHARPTPPKPNQKISPRPRRPFSTAYFNPSFLRTWTVNVVVGSGMLLWARDHYIDVFRVNGASMAPSINPDVHETGRRDYIVMEPLTPRKRAEKEGAIALKRGDIVTFWKPHRPEGISIKRVVGLEGDEVYPTRGYACEEGNGMGEERLQGMTDGLEDSDPDSVASGRQERGKIVVPYGHVWLEGDNEEKSLDSRDFGPVSRALLTGRAMRFWRGWVSFEAVEDKRSRKEKEKGSRVVEGRMEVPSIFLD